MPAGASEASIGPAHSAAFTGACTRPTLIAVPWMLAPRCPHVVSDSSYRAEIVPGTVARRASGGSGRVTAIPRRPSFDFSIP